ncbi:MAG: hypothetical protein WCV68_02780 [Candidatus Paceibacterota bacterium]|jgi:hypothetical protein
MKNYIIVAVIIILIIVGVVWFKAKSPAPTGETVVTTEATTTIDTSVAPAAEVPAEEAPVATTTAE